jgi:hypothetical protein
MDAGVLISGFNPLQADRAASELMGFPWRKIPALRHCADSGILYARALNSPHVFLCGDIEGADKIPNLKFVPPPGWESLALGFQESQTPYSSKINTICRV